MHPHAKYHLSEEKLILEIVKKELEPWRRVPSSSYSTMSYRAGDLRDIYDASGVQKSHEEGRAAMERLEIIKTAKGPMLRSQLVAEVCATLLAAGSTKGYTFHTTSDAPGPSSTSSRNPDPSQGTTFRDRTVKRSRGHLSVCVLNLGNWERSRERSTPQCFHHLIIGRELGQSTSAIPPVGTVSSIFQYQLPRSDLARGQLHPPS